MADQDPELQAIRAARLAQLQKGRPTAGAGDAAGGGGEQEAEQRQKQEQARRDMLATVLDSSARERREFMTCGGSLLLKSPLFSVPHCSGQSEPLESDGSNTATHGPERSIASEGYRRAVNKPPRAGRPSSFSLGFRDLTLGVLGRSS